MKEFADMKSLVQLELNGTLGFLTPRHESP